MRDRTMRTECVVPTVLCPSYVRNMTTLVEDIVFAKMALVHVFPNMCSCI